MIHFDTLHTEQDDDNSFQGVIWTYLSGCYILQCGTYLISVIKFEFYTLLRNLMVVTAKSRENLHFTRIVDNMQKWTIENLVK